MKTPDAARVGYELTTHGRTITTADIVNFAGVSGDFHPAHLDEARMNRSPYGKPIAHGDLVLSVTLGLLWQTRKRPASAFESMDRVRFPAPTFAGDTIHAHAELKAIEDVGGERREVWAISAHNQRGETVCAFTRSVSA